MTNYMIPIIFVPILLSIIVMIYAPAKDYLRFKLSHVCLILLMLSAIVITGISISTMVYSHDFDWINGLGVVLLFIVYHQTTTLHISQSTAIFMLICAFYTFFANFSIIFDAHLNPTGDLVDYSFKALLFLMALSILFCVLCVYPLAKYGSYIITHTTEPRIWWTATLVSTFFYAFNLCAVVHHYSTLHTNKVGRAYTIVMIAMFMLLMLLCVIFYMIVNAVIQKAETDDRNHILEMQEKQYESLQKYIDADTKVRHDFRQTIYTLKEFSEEKDYQAIDDYLLRYIETLPKKETVDFCRDHALNALLNHYSRKADANDIKLELKVMLPNTIHIESIDICSVVGNILENAVASCLEIPEDKRFIRMIISEEQNREIYIAVSNSFNGVIKKTGDRYFSTHKGGNGIGLISVAATAARYGGTADFSHDDDVFYSNIILVNR